MRKFALLVAAALVTFASTQQSVHQEERLENSSCCNPYWFEKNDQNLIVQQNIRTINQAKIVEEKESK